LKNTETLCGLAENVRGRLEDVVEGNEELEGFIGQSASFSFVFFDIFPYLLLYSLSKKLAR